MDQALAAFREAADLFLDGSAVVGRMALTAPALTHVFLAPDRAR